MFKPVVKQLQFFSCIDRVTVPSSSRILFSYFVCMPILWSTPPWARTMFSFMWYIERLQVRICQIYSCYIHCTLRDLYLPLPHEEQISLLPIQLVDSLFTLRPSIVLLSFFSRNIKHQHQNIHIGYSTIPLYLAVPHNITHIIPSDLQLRISKTSHGVDARRSQRHRQSENSTCR